MPAFVINLFWWGIMPHSAATFLALLFFQGPYVLGAIHALKLNHTNFLPGLLSTYRHSGFYGLILIALVVELPIFGLWWLALCGLLVHVGLDGGKGLVNGGLAILLPLGMLGLMVRFWPLYYLYMADMSAYGVERCRIGDTCTAKLTVFSLPWQATAQRGASWRFTGPALIALLLLHLTMIAASDQALLWQGRVFFAYAAFLAPLLNLLIVERAHRLCMQLIESSANEPAAEGLS